MIDPRALAELDAWVAEEVAAVSVGPRTKDDKVVDARNWASERRSQDNGDQDPVGSPTMGDDGPGPDRAADDEGLPYDPGEEAFIEATVGWLSGRANADILLEEIWRRLEQPAADSEDVVVPINLPQAEPEWPPADDLDDGDAEDDPEPDEPAPESDDG